MNAKEMIDALRRGLVPDTMQDWPKGLFCPEIESPRTVTIGPRGGKKYGPRRRADLVWAPRDRQGDPVIHVYEVKVSRGDLRSELAQPEKTKAWKQYANYFWLAVPDVALIAGIELPDDWGVVTPPVYANRRKMVVVKPAQRLSPIDQGPAYNRLCSWAAFRNWQQDTRTSLHDRTLATERRERDRAWAQVSELRAGLDQLKQQQKGIAA